MFQSPQICYRDTYPCKGSEKRLILNPFIIKNDGYDPKKLQLTKILYNSGPHFTWVRWKFLQFFFIFFNPFPTHIFSLHPSQDWCLFSIFRVHLWRNTQRYIKNNVCSSKQKGYTSLSIYFYLLGPDPLESKIAGEKGQHF